MSADRDLDAAIAESIFGWSLANVGPDINGENECRILSENGQVPLALELPRKGLIHRGFLCPLFSSDWEAALRLARRIGLQTPASELADMGPEKIARLCLKLHNEKRLR